MSLGSFQVKHAQSRETVVIHRRKEETRVLERFVPGRFFRGIIPDTIVDHYQFWESEATGDIRGYPKLNTIGASGCKRFYENTSINLQHT